jgi:hypothetical protein
MLDVNQRLSFERTLDLDLDKARLEQAQKDERLEKIDLMNQFKEAS